MATSYPSETNDQEDSKQDNQDDDEDDPGFEVVIASGKACILALFWGICDALADELIDFEGFQVASIDDVVDDDCGVVDDGIVILKFWESMKYFVVFFPERFWNIFVNDIGIDAYFVHDFQGAVFYNSQIIAMLIIVHHIFPPFLGLILSKNIKLSQLLINY